MSHQAPSSVWNSVTERDARRVRQQQSDGAVLERARFLPEDIQRLLHLALSGRYSYREIAELVGSNPGSVCRRVKRWVKRLSEPVAVMLLERPGGLSEEYQRIGLAWYLHGRGATTIARQEGMSEAEVKAVVAYLGRWAQLKREVGDGGAESGVGQKVV